MAERVLFTDLDGTLLDHHDYRPGPALAALRALRDAGVAVVPVTSKTAAEVRPLARRLGLADGWAVENGGALAWPDGECLAVGRPYGHVRAGLAEAARDAGATVRGFGDMDSGEVARLTGLDPPAVAAARRRELSETFLLLDGDLPALLHELSRRDLQAVQGGRFLTVSGRHDKGTAVRAFLSRAPAESWGVGDAGNDAPMLAAVDHPHQVRRADGTWADLDVAGVVRVAGVGPAGFVQVAERILG